MNQMIIVGISFPDIFLVGIFFLERHWVIQKKLEK